MQIRPNNEVPNITCETKFDWQWQCHMFVQTYVFGATRIIFLQIKLLSYIDSVEAYPR